MNRLALNPADLAEMVQEINKRFRNKKTLYRYLVEKTVSPRRPRL